MAILDRARGGTASGLVCSEGASFFHLPLGAQYKLPFHRLLLAMTKTLLSAISMASLALSTLTVDVAAEKICSIAPFSYDQAKSKYPHLAYAINALEEYPIAAWYTDRLSVTDRATMLKRITSECPEDSRMVIVVYGLPNKDCQSGEASAGSVNSTAAYKDFLKDLTTAIGDRNVLYVVEPDAASLQIDKSGCGAKFGYLENLKVAIEALSMNANAELYLDVGYWTILNDWQFVKVMPVIEELSASNGLHGIVLNTRNYRSTTEIAGFCDKFQKAINSTRLNCIVDTSRNYIPPQNQDWCNIFTAGIGAPPTSETNVPNLDYLLWIKAAGESDGTCNGGPDAGVFYEAAFQKLWDQGYLVHELGMEPIGAGDTSTTPTNGSVQSETPVFQSETPTTVTPTTLSVTPMIQSVTPTIQSATPLIKSVIPITPSETPSTTQN